MKKIEKKEIYAAPICEISETVCQWGLLEGSFGNEPLGEEFDLFTE